MNWSRVNSSCAIACVILPRRVSRTEDTTSPSFSWALVPMSCIREEASINLSWKLSRKELSSFVVGLPLFTFRNAVFVPTNAPSNIRPMAVHSAAIAIAFSMSPSERMYPFIPPGRASPIVSVTPLRIRSCRLPYLLAFATAPGARLAKSPAVSAK